MGGSGGGGGGTVKNNYNILNSYLTITRKSRSRQELFSTLLVHVLVIPNLQTRRKSLLDRHQGKTFLR